MTLSRKRVRASALIKLCTKTTRIVRFDRISPETWSFGNVPRSTLIRSSGIRTGQKLRGAQALHATQAAGRIPRRPSSKRLMEQRVFARLEGVGSDKSSSCPTREALVAVIRASIRSLRKLR